MPAFWPLEVSGEEGIGAMGEGTGDGFDGEVAETGDCPGILIGFHETSSVIGVVHAVKEELGVGLD